MNSAAKSKLVAIGSGQRAATSRKVPSVLLAQSPTTATATFRLLLGARFGCPDAELLANYKGFRVQGLGV